VPAKQVAMVNVSLETVSDDWFVDFDDDGVPDIPIGRLSVRTADDAAAVVAKIVGYDESSHEPWTKNVLLVADRNDDSSKFEQLSDKLGTKVSADYTAQRIFRSIGNDAARTALGVAVNNGQLIVNYTGHGSVQLWGGDEPLLQNEDVASWQTAGRLPFVVAMSCLNGLFNGIYGEDSLAEAMQRAPGGGAVAVWASSSLTPAETQAVVNQELFRLVFGGAYATLGEAIVAAKRVAQNQDLRRSLIFFGDPAMHLSGTPLSLSAPPPSAPALPEQPTSPPPPELPTPVPPVPPDPAPPAPAPVPVPPAAPEPPGLPDPGPSPLPGAPGSLTSSVVGSTLTLTWAAPASGVAPDWYVIEAGSFSGARDFVQATGSLATSFTANDVGAGTYFVRVRAENGAGIGPASSEVIVAVGAGGGPSPTDDAPGPPVELVVAVDGSTIAFAWNAPAAGGAPSAYWLDAGSSVGLSDLASFPTGSAATSFSMSGVPAGTYYVRARAVNDAGTSVPSNEVFVFVAGDTACSAPPSAPSGLRFAVEGSTVTVAWNAAAGSPTSYIIEAGSFPGEADALVSDTGTTATTMIATGISSATYFVRVRGRNSCGTSGSSNEVAIVVP
jgi:Peptidase family C25